MNAARRISGPLVALGSVVITVGLLVQPTPVGAASTHEPTLSALGTARIDGVMGRGEWDRAARIDFTLTIPAHDGGGSVPASLYVMNDALSLYVAVKAPGFYSAFNPAFEFDNDNDGRWPEEGDDVFLASASDREPAGPLVLVDDFRAHCPGDPAGPSGCGLEDTHAGEGYVPGTIDGAGAGFTSAADNSSFVEMSHPLDSDDNAHDFSLQAGSVVGVYLAMRVISANVSPDCGYPECFGDTRVPAQGADHIQGFAHIRIATPSSPTPASSGVWKATISGAGVSGRADLTVPAAGWATAAFSLSHLKTDVSVSARIVAGAACDATATTIKRLPGYTTTIVGTWRQRWVFDGADLVRLRSAIRSGMQLWFDVSAAGSRLCTRLVSG